MNSNWKGSPAFALVILLILLQFIVPQCSPSSPLLHQFPISPRSPNLAPVIVTQPVLVRAVMPVQCPSFCPLWQLYISSVCTLAHPLLQSNHLALTSPTGLSVPLSWSTNMSIALHFPLLKKPLFRLLLHGFMSRNRFMSRNHFVFASLCQSQKSFPPTPFYCCFFVCLMSNIPQI